ncbi:MAG: NUDIX domain-containing protein [Solirubrobacteraceae bacterium]
MLFPRRRGGRAAAVCWRRVGGALTVGLVTTSDGERWTFPKGHRKPGEKPAAAAAREAHEEAGVRGTVDDRRLLAYRYPARGGGDDVVVDAYLLHVTGVGEPLEAFRSVAWCDPPSARRRLAEGRDGFHAAELERVLDAALRRLR